MRQPRENDRKAIEAIREWEGGSNDDLVEYLEEKGLLDVDLRTAKINAARRLLKLYREACRDEDEAEEIFAPLNLTDEEGNRISLFTRLKAMTLDEAAKNLDDEHQRVESMTERFWLFADVHIKRFGRTKLQAKLSFRLDDVPRPVASLAEAESS
jgi:hypothetical protein